MLTISLFSFSNYNFDLIVNFPEQFEMCVIFFLYLYKLPMNQETMSRQITAFVLGSLFHLL